MTEKLPVFPLKDYWILILLGTFLGVLGYGYEWVVLRIGKGLPRVRENLPLAISFSWPFWQFCLSFLLVSLFSTSFRWVEMN